MGPSGKWKQALAGHSRKEMVLLVSAAALLTFALLISAALTASFNDIKTMFMAPKTLLAWR